MKNEKKNTEFEHFSALANDWWSKNGKFKILHDIQPIRIKFIFLSPIGLFFMSGEPGKATAQIIKFDIKRILKEWLRRLVIAHI